MAESNENLSEAKAEAFFASAREIAAKGNYNYAIDMYIEGIRCEPDSLREGHIPLRELAVKRHVSGGKKASMVERMKYLAGKEALDQMLNAEYLLAKDPNNMHHAQAFLKAAVDVNCAETVQWLADLVFHMNAAAKRPSFAAYVLLKDAYASVGLFEKAIVACSQASKLKPEDAEVADEYKRLSAELTVSRGKYDEQGDFRKSIMDREAQEKLQAQDGVVKSDFYRDTLIESARKELAANPNSTRSILNLASTLAEMEEDEFEVEAIKMLNDRFEAGGDFTFRQRAGEIEISRLRRHLRKARQAGSDQVAELTEKFNQAEMEHWRMCVEHYPTDLAPKYEYGARLMNSGSYDEAIPLLQESQRDPRRKFASMSRIGQCFFGKGWHTDAAEIFSRAIEQYEIKDDAMGKDLRYNLGLCYEQLGQTAEALEVFRKIAQVDFGYRDVSERVDALRSRQQ